MSEKQKERHLLFCRRCNQNSFHSPSFQHPKFCTKGENIASKWLILLRKGSHPHLKVSSLVNQEHKSAHSFPIFQPMQVIQSSTPLLLSHSFQVQLDLLLNSNDFQSSAYFLLFLPHFHKNDLRTMSFEHSLL